MYGNDEVKCFQMRVTWDNIKLNISILYDTWICKKQKLNHDCVETLHNEHMFRLSIYMLRALQQLETCLPFHL